MNTRTASLTMLAAGLLLTLTACGSSDSTVKTSADKPATTTSASAKKPADKPAATKQAPAHIGDTITLHGFDHGSKVAVTLLKWVDPAKGGDEFSEPDAGKRFVAAQIRITNTGTAVYDDSPSNGMQVSDSEGQRFDTTFQDVSAGPAMASTLKLRTGDKALGYIAFEVPKTSKISTVQFAMNSGFADEAGQWNIR
ncbi:DUF4352 domain-containing protein [Streptomyces sp. NPDC087422]|uniref:DUF4352 domain-containing protein n=1 Tax=Streptomyces sp. NPDC087422 TaxID=3365786 RepID=UPI00382DCA8A